MKKFRLALAAGLSIIAAFNPAWASTIFMGAYPDSLIIVDDGTGVVSERIKLATGLPTSIRMSNDRKRIYVTTITTSGIEVLDSATRKVINQFSLNSPTRRYRFNGGAPDPTGRYFYTVVQEIDKGIDRYTIGKPKYAVVDLQLKKIIRTAEVAAEDEAPGGGTGRGNYMVSDDGKFFYVFRDKVIVVATGDLKAVERFDLAKPEGTGMENVGFGGGVEALRRPDQYVSLFNAADPYIHNKVFGVARFNLANRQFTFSPIGPAPENMAGLQVTPDGKEAYTVVTNGKFGNKRCEFWRFDMSTYKVLAKSEFECKSRFQLGMSLDGKKLYIYGASYDIEVYDTQTLKLEQTWNLGNDATMAGMVIY